MESAIRIMTLIEADVARGQAAALFEQLKQTRRRRGDLPQELLAARLEVATNSVADWEACRDHPSSPHLMLWSRELGLRVAITDRGGIEIPAEANRDGPGDLPYAERELRRLSAALRAARARQRVSQAALACRLQVSLRTVGRWETAAGFPRPIGFVRWARALDSDVRLLPVSTSQPWHVTALHTAPDQRRNAG